MFKLSLFLTASLAFSHLAINGIRYGDIESTTQTLNYLQLISINPPLSSETSRKSPETKQKKEENENKNIYITSEVLQFSPSFNCSAWEFTLF